tara:strand:- start:1399 stop:1599 length:201 start_codon:yes stop_codon:yes gene_type:complete
MNTNLPLGIQLKQAQEALRVIAEFDLEVAKEQRLVDMKTNKELGCYWFSDALKEVREIARTAIETP